MLDTYEGTNNGFVVDRGIQPPPCVVGLECLSYASLEGVQIPEPQPVGEDLHLLLHRAPFSRRTRHAGCARLESTAHSVGIADSVPARRRPFLLAVELANGGQVCDAVVVCIQHLGQMLSCQVQLALRFEQGIGIAQ